MRRWTACGTVGVARRGRPQRGESESTATAGNDPSGGFAESWSFTCDEPQPPPPQPCRSHRASDDRRPWNLLLRGRRRRRAAVRCPSDRPRRGRPHHHRRAADRWSRQARDTGRNRARPAPDADPGRNRHAPTRNADPGRNRRRRGRERRSLPWATSRPSRPTLPRRCPWSSRPSGPGPPQRQRLLEPAGGREQARRVRRPEPAEPPQRHQPRRPGQGPR